MLINLRKTFSHAYPVLRYYFTCRNISNIVSSQLGEGPDSIPATMEFVGTEEWLLQIMYAQYPNSIFNVTSLILNFE
jgi:hypothetical protein